MGALHDLFYKRLRTKPEETSQALIGQEVKPEIPREELSDDPTLALLGVPASSTTKVERSEFSEDPRVEAQKEEARLKAIEEAELKRGFDVHAQERPKASELSDSELILAGQIPKRAIIRKIAHPHEDTEND